MDNNHPSQDAPQQPNNHPTQELPKQRVSHLFLLVLSALLITFFLTSSLTLLAISAKNSGIVNTTELTLFLVFVAGVVSMISGGAIYMSWRKITWFLHVYEFVCLVVLVSFILVLIAIIMMNSKTSSPSNTTIPSPLQSKCGTPSNFFQYQMQNLANNAANLICTPNCPCPKYTQVQQCPAWQTTPYQTIMNAMELEFGCSGWCQINDNANFMFSGVKDGVEPNGTCFQLWSNWVETQWRAIIGCVSTMVVILYLNILSVNWRIFKICNEND